MVVIFVLWPPVWCCPHAALCLRTPSLLYLYLQFDLLRWGLVHLFFSNKFRMGYCRITPPIQSEIYNCFCWVGGNFTRILRVIARVARIIDTTGLMLVDFVLGRFLVLTKDSRFAAHSLWARSGILCWLNYAALNARPTMILLAAIVGEQVGQARLRLVCLIDLFTLSFTVQWHRINVLFDHRAWYRWITTAAVFPNSLGAPKFSALLDSMLINGFCSRGLLVQEGTYPIVSDLELINK